MFDSKKILTCRLKDYIDSRRKELSDYELVGVHKSSFGHYIKSFDAFRRVIPKEAEAVVDFRYTTITHQQNYLEQIMFGIALVPKSD